MAKKKKPSKTPGRRDETPRGSETRITGRETHHFFVTSVDLMVPMRDDDKKIMVFLTRAKAQEVAEKRLKTSFATVGMGDAKWAIFQQENPDHVVIGG